MEKEVIRPSFSYKLLHPRNTVLVSCVDESNGGNIITIAWSMPLSMNPPMLAISITPQRHSHHLIIKSGEFVVNIPTISILKNALVCGRISGKKLDKFFKANLTPVPAIKLRSPIIKECVAHIECKLKETMTTGDHTLMIGDVLEAYADRVFFSNDGFDIKRYKPIFHVGGDDFTTVKSGIIKPEI
jgi:flavin reductase (DIM6/NTAB) family NADH-FMN oxidoreductase RutF